MTSLSEVAMAQNSVPKILLGSSKTPDEEPIGSASKGSSGVRPRRKAATSWLALRCRPKFTTGEVAERIPYPWRLGITRLPSNAISP